MEKTPSFLSNNFFFEKIVFIVYRPYKVSYQDNPLVNSKVTANFVPKSGNFKVSLKKYFDKVQ